MTRRKAPAKTTAPSFAPGDTVEIQVADVTSDMHGMIGTVVSVTACSVYVLFEGDVERRFEPTGFYLCEVGKV